MLGSEKRIEILLKCILYWMDTKAVFSKAIVVFLVSLVAIYLHLTCNCFLLVLTVMTLHNCAIVIYSNRFTHNFRKRTFTQANEFDVGFKVNSRVGLREANIIQLFGRIFRLFLFKALHLLRSCFRPDLSVERL